METRSFYYTAGIAGIGSAILYLLSIIGLQAYLASSMDNMTAFTQNIIDSHSMMLLYGWPGIIATLLILPLMYTFYMLNKTSKHISRIVFLVTLLGLCFIIIAYLFHLAFTYFYAPIHHTLEGQQHVLYGIIIKSTVGLQDMFWLSGDIFAFLGIAIILWLNFREQLFPKWVLLFGILSGVLAAFGSFSFIPAFKHLTWLSFTFIGGFSLFTIWEIIASIILIKKSKQQVH